jgi:hypothetical protein
MAYFLFIDESGHDRKEAPYEVLAGISVRDSDLWNLINSLHDAEVRCFGQRYSQGYAELKGRKILKKKVFEHLQLSFSIPQEDVAVLASAALNNGAEASAKHLKALAMAKVKYVEDVLNICSRFHCQVFASVVETDAEATSSDGLRKDYAYLFERFFYYLDDQRPREQGIIVFDEIAKAQSHLLVNQASEYFKTTATGRLRSNLIILEPFFVHSELTTGIQLADLASYIISWGFRTSQITKPARVELARFAEQVSSLRYKAIRDINGNPNYAVWSIAHITDLRTRSERGGD